MSVQNVQTVVLPSAGLGGSGRADPARVAAVAIEALAKAAAPGMSLTSLSLELTAVRLADKPVSLAVTIDKQTRAVMFATCEAHLDGALVFSARALFAGSES